MTSLKTVLLGSAAGILAVGAAQAADLPVKKAAAAVQYVEACPVYGSGFYKLPGTDICIRHFGSMKFNFAFQNAREAWEPNYDNTISPIVGSGAANTIGWQWTIRPGWDFRSPTEYGTLRTVVQLRVDQRNGVHNDDDPTETGSMRTSNLIHRGYIEWAGFIIGRAGSQFVYWDQDDVITAIGGSPKTTAMQATYVFSAPGGFKATIGVEDSNAWESGAGSNMALQDLAVSTPGPNRFYDVVGTLSTEQAWGNAKLSAAAHVTQVNWEDPNAGFGAPDNNGQNWGWAVLGGITFNLPTLGPKDQLLLESTYSDGAVAYSGINGGADNNSTSFERVGQYLEGLQRNDVDTYAVRVGHDNWEFENTKVWTVAGQLRHYWAPLWRTNVMASYRNIDVPGKAANLTGIGDATAWDVAANLIWGQSRKTAEIGVEAVYKSLSQDVSKDIQSFANTNGVDTDPSGWAVSFFIQRAW
jgi:Porin subfamily